MRNAMAFLLFLAALSTLILLTSVRLRRYARLPYPPGPRPRFLIGNLRDIPVHLPWLTYTEWGKKYGEILHARIFGEHIVILNSVKVAIDLLEKRSSTYSDRPTIPMLSLMGSDFNFGFMPHGDKWRKYRRMFHQHFRKEAIPDYRPTQVRKIHDLLRRLVATPEDFYVHIKTLAAGIIMAITYGHEVQTTQDRFVDLAHEVNDKVAAGVQPGAFAVNSFPFLRHIPAWIPGCGGFHEFARDTRIVIAEHLDAPFDFVQKNMRDGAYTTSMLSKILERIELHGGSVAEEQVAKEVAAVTYSAGFDTTSAAVSSFFVAMARNPDVQRKAQAEIDNIIGISRLPIFEDRPSLPYVEAVYRELLRWRPPVPLGVPHAVTQDDLYDGYLIPRGATVFSNIWAMMHDETTYPDADKFIPDRFLAPEGTPNKHGDDTMLVFGFGRRICPGRYAADAALWLAIVSILSALDIQQAKDAAGNEIEVDPVWTDAIISYPVPFDCSVNPRSEAAKKLIEETKMDT
ncbi:cytochrome P450 [Roridomyces roridus]|uniref:Cytochrome P450 n=1 Tax=Roridomyces roridus TaxID=1738132 RepID=A0AAD7CB19_9AGAR|nr:cytochrome P450 [Roridomyces roridus]